jgi:hypothetical protein
MASSAHSHIDCLFWQTPANKVLASSNETRFSQPYPFPFLAGAPYGYGFALRFRNADDRLYIFASPSPPSDSELYAKIFNMNFNDGILDITSDPALLFEELGPFAIPFDDYLPDPPDPTSSDQGPLLDALPALGSTVPSHVDPGYDIEPMSVVTHHDNNIPGLQTFDPLFNSNEFDNPYFGASLSSLDLVMPTTSTGIASPRTLAFLVEADEILSNTIPSAENRIHSETNANTVTALDDTTLERRDSWQVEHSTSPMGDTDTWRLQFQDTTEDHEVKEMKDLQMVFPINQKPKATSGDGTGNLKPRRYVPLQCKTC